MSEKDEKVEKLIKDLESLEKDMDKIRDEYTEKMRELMLILFEEWKEKRTDNLFSS